MKVTGYNILRDDSALLEENEKLPPSFSVYLYPEYWTLNNGPKFLYNNQVSSILEDIRAYRIPADFIQIFDDAGVPYYKGCLIAELVDYRPARAKDPLLEKPDVQRVVLRPNPETVWADICMLNVKAGARMSDKDAIQLEAKLLLATSTPLCLDPDPHLTRAVNSALRVSAPATPNSLKRKAAAMVDLEEDETEKAKRTKIMQYMNPLSNASRKPFHPSYKILNLMSMVEKKREEAKHPPRGQVTNNMGPLPTQSNGLGTASASTPANAIAQAVAVPAQPPVNPPTVLQPPTIPQPIPIIGPSNNIPPQLQQAAATGRTSPSKQEQVVNGVHMQRPLSQAGMAQPAAAQTMPTNPQQARVPTPQQMAQFTPPLPPSNFLIAPPVRRRSTLTKPGTPAPTQQQANLIQPLIPQVPQIQSVQAQQRTTSQSPAPSQSPAHVQPQPLPPQQVQAQPQQQPQVQAPMQTQQQQQPQVQALAQSQAQVQAPQNQVQPQAQMQSQQMPNLSNLTPAQLNYYRQVQFQQQQALYARMQAAQASQNGRSTPAIPSVAAAAANAARGTSATPAPQLARPGTANVMISGRSTPAVTASPQIARASPAAAAAANPAVAAAAAMARAGTVQPAAQQQQRPMGQGQMSFPASAQAQMQFQMQYQQRMAAMAALNMQNQGTAVSQQQQQQQLGLQQQHQHQHQQQQQVGVAQGQQQSHPNGVQISGFPAGQVNQMAQQHMYQIMMQQRQQQMMGRGMANGQQAMPPGLTMQQMQNIRTMQNPMQGSLPNR